MSYCRWSDGDVYCYESARGYEVHVARSRRVGPTPQPRLDWTNERTILDSTKAQDVWRRTSSLVPIGLPFDGQNFCLETAEECLKTLIELREAGYIVPDYATDDLREEIADQSPEQTGIA